MSGAGRILASAHEMRGMDVFEREDGKYFASLQARMESPQDGW